VRNVVKVHVLNFILVFGETFLSSLLLVILVFSLTDVGGRQFFKLVYLVKLCCDLSSKSSSATTKFNDLKLPLFRSILLHDLDEFDITSDGRIPDTEDITSRIFLAKVINLCVLFWI